MVCRKCMIYGAYGYAGQLVAQEAVLRGLNPVLAGRNREKLTSLAGCLGLSSRCFDLENKDNIALNLQGISVLLNCAGPFSSTCVPLVKTCIMSGIDYLDLSVEIEVFEYMASLEQKAWEAGIVLCPGVGFGVIPTDCLAAVLKEELPGAQNLALAFSSKSKISPGTAKTIIESLKYKGRIRKNGAISTVAIASKVRKINFGNEFTNTVSIPWGDVSTAFYTTGIPDIVVYCPVPKGAVIPLKFLRIFRFVLTLEMVQRFLKKQVQKRIKGPSHEELRARFARLWGEVSDGQGNIIQGRFTSCHPYLFTARGSVGVVEKLLNVDIAPGFYTPSKLMGPHYAKTISGTTRIRLSRPRRRRKDKIKKYPDNSQC